MKREREAQEREKEFDKTSRQLEKNGYLRVDKHLLQPKFIPTTEPTTTASFYVTRLNCNQYSLKGNSFSRVYCN